MNKIKPVLGAHDIKTIVFIISMAILAFTTFLSYIIAPMCPAYYANWNGCVWMSTIMDKDSVTFFQYYALLCIGFSLLCIFFHKNKAVFCAGNGMFITSFILSVRYYVIIKVALDQNSSSRYYNPPKIGHAGVWFMVGNVTFILYFILLILYVLLTKYNVITKYEDL